MELDMLEYIANSAPNLGRGWPIPSSKKLVHALRTSLGDNALNALQRHLHEATKQEWLAYAKRQLVYAKRQPQKNRWARMRDNADKLALLDKHAADLTSYQIESVKACERVWWRRASLPPGKALVEELRTISAAGKAARVVRAAQTKRKNAAARAAAAVRSGQTKRKRKISAIRSKIGPGKRRGSANRAKHR